MASHAEKYLSCKCLFCPLFVQCSSSFHMLSTKEHIQNIEKKLFSRFSFEAGGDNKIKKTKKQKPHLFTDKRLVALKNQLKSLPSKISFLNIRGF